MLFRQKFLEGIRRGAVTLAFRRWTKPTVKAGGTLLTPVGRLRIAAVEEIDAADITDADARKAGFENAGAVREELNQRSAGRVYRIRIKLAGPDPRISLRNKADFSPDDLENLRTRLARLDKASARGHWTLALLKLVARRPAVRAAELADEFGLPTARLKLDVRKLKNLGLTESLSTGYRISPRGRALLDHL